MNAGIATPNWFSAMVEFRWTVKNIMGSFDIPRALATQIQHGFPTYVEICLIASAHRELSSQIGH